MDTMNRIYFDNAATTRLRPAVLDAMMPYLTTHYGNASSVHSEGAAARAAVNTARAQTAAALGADEQQIYFTGSGTEADNWALFSATAKSKRRHIITSAIEHHAILHAFQHMQRSGYRVTILPVDRYGRVSPDALRTAIDDDTAFVSIMFANNEIGTVQNIAELCQIAHEHGALFHTDAVQAVGSIPVDVKALGVDMLSLAAHKFGGMKGVGALYHAKGKPSPYIHGGAQERGARAGTTNVAGIVSLGAAIQLATADIPKKSAYVSTLRDKLIGGILDTIPHTTLAGHPTQRLPGNVNVTVRYVEGESMVLMLDMFGIACSSGSACTSDSIEPSHVLLAMGYSHELAQGSLRFSLSEENTIEEVDQCLAVFPRVVQTVRDRSPLTPRVLRSI